MLAKISKSQEVDERFDFSLLPGGQLAIAIEKAAQVGRFRVEIVDDEQQDAAQVHAKARRNSSEDINTRCRFTPFHGIEARVGDIANTLGELT